MSRHPDWPERLHQVIAHWQHRPFIWGQSDCAHFALACLQAVSARDWGQVALTPYASARGARRLLARWQLRHVGELATRLLGPPGLLPAQIGRGDLVELQAPDGPALGVCLGAQLAAMSEHGLIFLPRASGRAGWRI